MAQVIANPSPTQVLGRANECLRRLLEAGLPFDALQLPITDAEARDRLVTYWSAGCYEPTTDQRLAREIMGLSFFGVEEAVRHFGLKPKKAQLTTLGKIRFSEAILRECQDTHLLVGTFPLSILEIRAKVDRGLFCSYEDAWYNNGEPFAKLRCLVAWHLIRKTPVPNSTSKTWDEQQALLAENKETPQTNVMVYATIGHFLATGERLFPNLYVRCSDLDSGGPRVYLGRFDAHGLYVSYYWDVNRNGHIGLASARK